MVRKGLMALATATALMTSSVASSAQGFGQPSRNQAALGYAGLGPLTAGQCATGAASPLAIRNQCAMGDASSALRGRRGGGILVGLFALIVVVLAVVIIVKEDPDVDEEPTISA